MINTHRYTHTHRSAGRQAHTPARARTHTLTDIVVFRYCCLATGLCVLRWPVRAAAAAAVTAATADHYGRSVWVCVCARDEGIMTQGSVKESERVWATLAPSGAGAAADGWRDDRARMVF